MSFVITEGKMLSMDKGRTAGTLSDGRVHVASAPYQRPKLTSITASPPQCAPGSNTLVRWQPLSSDRTRIQRMWLRWDIVNTSAANMTLITPSSLISNIKMGINNTAVIAPESGYSARAMQLLQQMNLARLDAKDIPEALYDAAQSFTPEDGVTIPAGQTKTVWVDLYLLFPGLNDWTTNSAWKIDELLFEIQFVDKGSAQNTSQAYIASADVDVLGAANFMYTNIGLYAYEVRQRDPILINGILTPALWLPEVDFIDQTMDLSTTAAVAQIKLSQFPSRARYMYLFAYVQDYSITSYNSTDRCRIWSGSSYLQAHTQQFGGDSATNVPTTDPQFRQMWANIVWRAMYGRRYPHELMSDVDSRTRLLGMLGTCVNLSFLESEPNMAIHAGVRRIEGRNEDDYEISLSPVANGILPATSRITFAAVSDRMVRYDPKSGGWSSFLF